MIPTLKTANMRGTRCLVASTTIQDAKSEINANTRMPLTTKVSEMNCLFFLSNIDIYLLFLCLEEGTYARNFYQVPARTAPKKCAYSHSRAHLPSNGWWNNSTEVVAAKKIYPLINDAIPPYNQFRDILIENPNARRFAARVKCQSVLASETSMWPEGDAIFEKHQRPQLSAPLSLDPLVLVLSFEYDDIYGNIHSHLYSTLEDKATTMHIRSSHSASIEQALRILEVPHLTAVLIADAGIVKKKYAKVVDKLVAFVQRGGSVAIGGGQFCNFITPDKFSPFISKFGVSWTWGSYFRTTFTANPANELVTRNPSLLKSYSMKTVHLANITPEMAIYHATDDSRLTSLVWDPVRVSEFSAGEAPAVCARVGQGLLSFLGDVNGEQASTPVILSMLGLLDQSNVLPHAESAHTSGNSQPTASGSGQPNASTSEYTKASISNQPPTTGNSQPQTPTSTPSNPNVMASSAESILHSGYQGPARTKIFSPKRSSQDVHTADRLKDSHE